VRIVVIENGGGGIFHFLPQAQALTSEEFEALLGTPRDLDLSKVAALFGLAHWQIEAPQQLLEALDSGTGLIEVSVERRSNVELHQRLVELVSRAIHPTT